MAEINNPISKELIDSMNKYAEESIKAANALTKLIEQSEKLIQSNEKASKSDTGNAEKKKTLTAVEKEAERIRKKQIQTHAKLDNARTAAAKSLKKLELENKKVNKEVTDNIKISQRSVLATQAQKGAYEAISNSLSSNLLAWKKLTKEERENTKAGRQLTRTIKAQRAELEKLDKSTGNASRGVGKYRQGVISAGKSLIGAFGVTVGLAAFVRVMGNAIKVSIEFEAVMSKVRAISGATNQEYKQLKDNAKTLGETTQKTAAEAAQLQVELSKLGLTPKQILSASGAILKLSIATGEDLAQSAKVAAGTLKSFNLRADQSQRVTDVMAKSFSSSALDLSKFETAMANAGTVLSANNVTLEKGTAQLSVLVDRNIDASTAGSALRNIYLDLNKHGLTYNEAMNQINRSTNKSQKAFELFGKRGATVALVLATNQDKVENLTKAYENSAGAAQRMADIMEDNLKGDVDKASSALSGLAINLGERLTPAARKVTQAFTGFVSKISEYVKIKPQEEIRKQTEEVNSLAIQLSSTNIPLSRRNEIYQRLKEISPDIVEGIEAENVSLEKLRENLKKYNELQIKKLALAEVEEKKREALEEAGKAQNELIDAENELSKRLNVIKKQASFHDEQRAEEIQNVIISEGDLIEKTKEATRIYSEITAARIKDSGVIILSSQALASESKILKAAKSAADDLKDARINLKEATDNVTTATDQLSEKYTRLFGQEAGAIEDVNEFVDAMIQAEEDISGIDFEGVSPIKLSKEEIKAFKDSKKEQITIAENAASAIEQVESDIYDFDVELANQTNDELEKIRQENVKNAKKATEQIKQSEDKAANERVQLEREKTSKIIDLTAMAANGINDLLLESSSQRRDEELQRISEQRDEDLERVETEQQEDLQQVQDKLDLGLISEDEAAMQRTAINKRAADEKKKIDEEADKKEAAIKTKQAKAEKRAALIGVAIDVAAGVAKALTNPYTAPAVIPFVLATGAIQAAIIAAQPIPKFAKGVESSPDTFIAGDSPTGNGGARELMVTRKGDLMITPNRPTLYTGMEGTKIIPNNITEEILKMSHTAYDDKGVRGDLKDIKRAIYRSGSTTKNNVRTSRGERRTVRQHLEWSERMRA